MLNYSDIEKEIGNVLFVTGLYLSSIGFYWLFYIVSDLINFGRVL